MGPSVRQKKRGAPGKGVNPSLPAPVSNPASHFYERLFGLRELVAQWFRDAGLILKAKFLKLGLDQTLRTRGRRFGFLARQKYTTKPKSLSLPGSAM